MDIQDIKAELNKFLIKTNFEEHENKTYYKVSKEDLIRLLIKFMKLIERISYERDY